MKKLIDSEAKKKRDHCHLPLASTPHRIQACCHCPIIGALVEYVTAGAPVLIVGPFIVGVSFEREIDRIEIKKGEGYSTAICDTH